MLMNIWLLFSYEMVYKQAVSTEDVFLGMGNKSPTTASCEDIIVSTASLPLILCSNSFALDPDLFAGSTIQRC